MFVKSIMRFISNAFQICKHLITSSFVKRYDGRICFDNGLKMPVIGFKHVISFSSEDKIHKAENLLHENTHGKWRCAKNGEAQAVVVLQLEKATRINSIDIGNDGSAFVEVLVARSGNDKDYQVLLVASSFMTPSESRSGNGANKVRMFSNDQLSTDISKQLWDRVKVVCTQPFNKHTTYGLTFINLHSKEVEEKDTKNDEEISSTSRTTFGKFRLKAEDKQTTVNVRNTTLKPEDTTSKKAKQDQPSSTKIDKNLVKKEMEKQKPPLQKRKMESFSKPKHQQTGDQKTGSANPTKRRKVEDVPFHQTMKDVVFVISGFQNPKRSELRDKALSMGARYKKDWGDGCTHLICAFANTPKFRQVLGDPHGRIVRADWIIDCATQKKQLPWKRYSMDPNTQADDDDDSGSDGDKLPAGDDPYDASTDEEDDDVIDTDDEIERAKQEIKSKTKNSGAPPIDPYDVSTDEEGDTSVTSLSDLPRLPDYFSGKTFFLHGEFPPEMERMLRRHIVTCEGSLDEYMTDDVRYVVTQQSWDSTFDDALKTNSSLVFVKPTWVFECGHSETLLPHTRYLVPSN